MLCIQALIPFDDVHQFVMVSALNAIPIAAIDRCRAHVVA
jgi:hypothetical protein